MCTREMSPSALQRVCPLRREAQVVQSFLRMGVPREACHVPGVRCSDSTWFVLSHTDMVTEGKARKYERRGVFPDCSSFHDSPQVRCISELCSRGGLKPTSCLIVERLTAERPVLCFARAPSCHPPLPGSTKVQVLIE